MFAAGRLRYNIRFYILASSICLSLFLMGLVRVQFASGQLFYIRLEQVFGFVSLFYWYLALVIGPVSKLIGPRWGMPQLQFSRRAIGVSAAYFALFHAAVAFFGQIGGFAGIGLLPARFQWSLLFGVLALMVLLAMAATSFDKAIRFMTFPRWKLLQRFVYAAGILAILHVWLVGTHIAYVDTQIVAFVLLAVLFGFESVGITKIIAKRAPVLTQQKELWVTVFVCVWLFWVGLVLLLPKVVTDYHGQHQHTAAHAAGEHRHE
jgi:DMSO/TMAO reductase YedYZ heme-binding membrane subunit